jgi:hypothetical protein
MKKFVIPSNMNVLFLDNLDLLSVQILLTTLCLVVGVYTILCWYLIITGKTLVEFTRR